jgi:Spondin_N
MVAAEWTAQERRVTMLKKLPVLLIIAVAGVLVLGLGPGGASADSETRTYEVTIENLTDSQPFSPPVAATHRPNVDLFTVGDNASDEIEAIAEDGNQIPAFNLLSDAQGVTDVFGDAATPPVLRNGMLMFEIDAKPGDRLSLATMLICTNDGITGVDSVALPKNGAAVFMTAGYDAGTEDNTQNSADIVDPCSAIGPVALAGDPNGNSDAGPDTSPAQPIHHHSNIHGSGDLDPGDHGWTDPVARITVERIN